MANLLGYQGVIVAQPIADVLTAAVGFWLYRRAFGPNGRSIRNW